ALTFLLARVAVIRESPSAWVIVFPLLFVGGFEAAWSLTQGSATLPFDAPRGTFENRNHLAGQLEMVFPFAAMYAAACLARASGKGFSVTGALRFCSAVGLTLLLVVAQARTLSRMGLISM